MAYHLLKQALYLKIRYPSIEDPLHSVGEKRLVIIGMSYNNRVLVVVHTDRGNRLRIISARKATRKERKYYETTV